MILSQFRISVAVKKALLLAISCGGAFVTLPNFVGATPPSGYAVTAVIKSVDAEKSTITFTVRTREGAVEREETVAPDTRITIEGKSAKLMDLKPGVVAAVAVQAKGRRYVSSITVDAPTMSVEDGLKLYVSGKLPPEDFQVTYSDMHGLHGGMTITVEGDGKVRKESVDPRKGRKKEVVEGQVKASEVRSLAEKLLADEAWRQKVDDRPAVPDESKATLKIKTAGGACLIWEWYNDLKKNDRLLRHRTEMERLVTAAEINLPFGQSGAAASVPARPTVETLAGAGPAARARIPRCRGQDPFPATAGRGHQADRRED